LGDHLHPIQVLKQAPLKPHFVANPDKIFVPKGIRQVRLVFLLARYFGLKMPAQTGALTRYSTRQVLVRADSRDSIIGLFRPFSRPPAGRSSRFATPGRCSTLYPTPAASAWSADAASFAADRRGRLLSRQQTRDAKGKGGEW
jgi:hypothetical protein